MSYSQAIGGEIRLNRRHETYSTIKAIMKRGTVQVTQLASEMSGNLYDWNTATAGPIPIKKLSPKARNPGFCELGKLWRSK
jgi:hypothetical protein